MTKITSTEKKTRKKLAIHWQILIGIGSVSFSAS